MGDVVLSKRSDMPDFTFTASEMLVNSLTGYFPVIKDSKNRGDEMDCMDRLDDALKMRADMLKKLWEEADIKHIDVDDELKDLLKVYGDAEENLKAREAQNLETLSHSMKRYLESKEERLKISFKLSNLKEKLKKAKNEEEDE